MADRLTVGEAVDRTRNRLESLTGLRFVAALLVVGHHTLASAQNRNPVVRLPYTSGIGAAGYVGVTFFFVLSGLVLAWSYDGARFDTFVGRRLSRIYPLHLFMLIAAVAVATLLLHHPSGGVRLVPVAALVHSWIPDFGYYLAGNLVSWSLACELAFYAGFPFLFRRISRLDPSRLIVVAGLALGWLIVVPVVAHALGGGAKWGAVLVVFPAYRVGEFVIGIVLAIALRNGWRSRISFGPAVALVVAGYAAAAQLSEHGLDSHVGLHQNLRLIGDLCILPGVVAVLAAAAGRDADGRPTAFAHAMWVRLGLWSFALYLSHFTLIQVFAHVWPTTPQGRLANAGRELLIVGLAVALSGALHVLVEHPAERRLRAIVDRRTRAALTA